MPKTVIAQWKLNPDHAENILQLLPELVEKTRSEPGNLLYTIYQSETNPHHLFIHERYADPAAIDAHKQSEHFQRIILAQIAPHLNQREVTPVKELL